MKISSSIMKNSGVISFEGNQVLGYEAHEFQEEVVKLLDKGLSSIIVNMSNVNYISSWGIGMLIHALTTTKNKGGDFKIAELHPNVLSVLKKVKIDAVLSIIDSVEDLK